jgi:hypothetical protein
MQRNYQTAYIKFLEVVLNLRNFDPPVSRMTNFDFGAKLTLKRA